MSTDERQAAEEEERGRSPQAKWPNEATDLQSVTPLAANWAPVDGAIRTILLHFALPDFHFRRDCSPSMQLTQLYPVGLSPSPCASWPSRRP